MLGFNENHRNAKHKAIDVQLAKVLKVRTSRAKIELSTRLGRILDGFTYAVLFWLILSLILSCAAYFYFATGTGHGIKVPVCELQSVACISIDEIRKNSLYFSIVTFSSLGYGDLLPEGIGKTVAVFEVLAGLVLTAIFVGKLASERQSTSLLLLLTSDNQRRLQEFCQTLILSQDDLATHLVDQDHARLLIGAGRGLNLVASIRKYLTFQANQAALATFGNVSSLRALYRTLYDYQVMSMDSFKTANANGAPRIIFGKIIYEVNAIAEVMMRFHPDDLECKNIFLNIGIRMVDFAKLEAANSIGLLKPVFLTEMTETLLQRVLSILTKCDFYDYPDKVISEKINISRRMAQRCIEELIGRADYRIPPMRTEWRNTDFFRTLAQKKEKTKRRAVVARFKRKSLSRAARISTLSRKEVPTSLVRRGQIDL